MGPLAPSRTRLLPLYAAGFVTAFGAHGIAVTLGGFAITEQASLLSLGVLLAVYDGAEVILKPIFGTLADRVGPRRVLIGGLVGFAVVSAAAVVVGWWTGLGPVAVGVARFGQGAAAAAFSPAASAMVSRLSPTTRQGQAFGRYGAWKGVGYTVGPLLGGALVAAGGLGLLFGMLALLAVGVAFWGIVAVPVVPPMPRARQTLLDLGRRLGQRGFLLPTLALAAATAALAVGVGFLPVRGAAAGLGPVAVGAVVSVLALKAALVQPWAGRRRDVGRLSEPTGMTVGLLAAAVGLGLGALLPGVLGLVAAAVAIGLGTGLVTPLGFAWLAAESPPERLGQTMGSAEVGRELGDAGGPLVVGGVAVVTSLTGGLLLLALLVALGASVVHRAGATGRSPAGSSSL